MEYLFSAPSILPSVDGKQLTKIIPIPQKWLLRKDRLLERTSELSKNQQHLRNVIGKDTEIWLIKPEITHQIAAGFPS